MKESLLEELYILRKRTMVKKLEIHWESYPYIYNDTKSSETILEELYFLRKRTMVRIIITLIYR